MTLGYSRSSVRQPARGGASRPGDRQRAREAFAETEPIE
jgi:hypothetical protein